jgi:hypothetical protein
MAPAATGRGLGCPLAPGYLQKQSPGCAESPILDAAAAAAAGRILLPFDAAEGLAGVPKQRLLKGAGNRAQWPGGASVPEQNVPPYAMEKEVR